MSVTAKFVAMKAAPDVVLFVVDGVEFELNPDEARRVAVILNMAADLAEVGSTPR